jgi:hypothetical protein
MTNIHSNQAQISGEFMCQKWRSYGISDTNNCSLVSISAGRQVVADHRRTEVDQLDQTQKPTGYIGTRWVS